MRKNKTFLVVFIIAIIALGVMGLTNKSKILGKLEVKSQYTDQTELIIKYKTPNSIAISWENIVVPENVIKFNAYSNDQFVASTTDKLYVFDNLTNGTSYNFRIDFLDKDDKVIDSKIISNVSTAITIYNFNESKIYSKDTYYLNGSLTIPQGIEINFEAGSIVKIPSMAILEINGILKLNGSNDNKVVVTSRDDIGYGISSYYQYWQRISVSESGTLNANNTDINYGGVDDDYLSPNLDNYIRSSGNVILKDVDAENCKTTNIADRNYSGSIHCYNGNISILNSNIPQNITLDNLKITDIENSNLGEVSSSNNKNYDDVITVSIKNNTLKGINKSYSIQSSKNNTDIEENKIDGQGIYYEPNILSTATIENNTAISGEIMISVSLNNANKDILNNIDNNTNLVSKRLGEIQITSVPQAEMTLPKRVYSIDNKLLSIPAGRKLSLSAGSMLKLPVYKILSVYGTLELNGTSENKVIVTSTEDIGVGVSSYDKYWQRIEVRRRWNFKC